MSSQRPNPWRSPSRFAPHEEDPLTGFANIMDVMLVFALGLMLALVAQSEELRKHFKLEQPVNVASSRELSDAPELLKQMQQRDGSGLQSLGQVYRDPKTGKLILIETNHAAAN
ncbi:DUF2149 domain-containing protein [Teredinibacter turnerae]|uniref:DUF2149 domain-containing protein n=1 Tax=Teredinibacter turnerae TaxID=2426 RepID=UPI0030CB8226